MNYKISTLYSFEKEIKKLVKKFPSLVSEYEELISKLKANPILGQPLGNNCYKIRLKISSKGKGKSGGARVITNVYVAKTTIYLLAIYDKSEQDSVDIKDFADIIKAIKDAE